MTWVPSIHAPSKYRKMHMYKRYDDKISRTHSTNKKHFDVIDNSGRVTGYFSQDSFTIAGLKIKNQSFGEALFEPDLFWRTKNDGILGLGFNNVDGDEEPSVFDNMVSQGLVEAPVFSIYLNRYGSSGPDSVFTLGGTNPDYFEEDFIFADLTVPHRWQFKIDRVQLSSGDSIFSKSGYQAVLDSSSSFIAGPFEETRTINLQLGGKSFRSRNGLTKLKGQDICASRILEMGWRKNDEADWVLGMNFMRAYCTQFDKGNHRIGFAKTYSYEDIITREPL
ncbi:cathepsin d [Plakobranchus ocellatus]|uniref:Cathepsin d n=1 Tax=Plakobranchus ocellatus TaxID=259542 RepID=A0AAV4E1G7_9GAST|nr:cathepsin d [Plakobranchus ocellatus]